MMGFFGVLLVPVLCFAQETSTLPGRPVDGDLYEEVLCSGRSPCFLGEARAAGTSTGREPLVVAEVVLAPEPPDTGGSPWRSPFSARELGIEGRCVPYEYWLVTLNGEGSLVRHQPLARFCNDGYGASGMGENMLEVGDNRIYLSRMGGSAWRWDTGMLAQLSPFRRLTERHGGYHSLGSNSIDEEWDWVAFRGTGRWESPRCLEGTEYPPSEGAEMRRYRYTLIPQVSIPNLPAEEPWASTSLGDCSLMVDAAGSSGYVIHGQPSGPIDARFRVLVVGERTIVVEVWDDWWVHQAESWLYSDHLELWVSPHAPADYYATSPCLTESHEAVQWAIMLQEGQVIPAHGDPAVSLTVRRYDLGEGYIRVAIELPEGMGQGITLVYSDSDDGTTQERLIATSDLVYPDAYSLGKTFLVTPQMAVCQVVEGELRVSMTPVPLDRPFHED